MNFLKSLSRQKRWKGPAAATLGFLEGSFVVFPMEPLLIPLMTTGHGRALVIALWAALGNLIAALALYALGALLFEPVVAPVLDFLSWTDEFETVREKLRGEAFWPLFLVGVTPAPFQAGTTAAGALGIAIPVFIAAVGVSRSLRYLAFGLIVKALGARAQGFIERHERRILIGGAVLFVAIAGAMIAFG